MKKIFSLLLVAIMISVFAVGCTQAGNPQGNGFDASREITLVSREDGSGTRGAFVEITGVAEDDVDNTYEEAVIQNGTNGVMTTVAGDEYGIGYISLGSLNDTVKALKVNGVAATSETVQSGDYKIARPFNVAYKGELSPLAADFLNFILSEEGQAIAVDSGYVQFGTELASYAPYVTTEMSGKIVAAGSTSVSPLMEKMAESYKALNPNVEIEIQSTGSSAGMKAAIEGACDIGMASRDLKDSEKAVLTGQAIAIDGIAMIVNNENPIEDISLEQVKSVYVGETTTWDSLVE